MSELLTCSSKFEIVRNAVCLVLEFSKVALSLAESFVGIVTEKIFLDCTLEKI